MADKKVVELLVSGGQATAGPPLGPALGPLGVNTMAVVNRINGTPTASALVVSELKIEKGSGTPNTAKVGNLGMDQVVRIAKIKRSELLARTLKGAAKEVLGSCISIGVTVEGKDPREVQREIDEGKYEELFSKGEE
jgi:large subunit ribosomal protein L11